MIERRTILITGGTSGLGLETSRILAADPQLHVVATGRAELDLGSLDSIAAFARDFAAAGHPPLTALVANAGAQFTAPATTKDGFEATIGINHLGHVALIARLLASGQLRGPGRIVIVSSGTHDPQLRTGMPSPRLASAEQMARPAPDTEAPSKAGRRRYTTSKLCNVMTAYELSRRLAPSGITVNAFDPGLMPGTGLARDAGGVQRALWSTVMRAMVVLPGVSTPKRSGATLAAMADGPSYAGVTGRYVTIDHERRSSAQSYDETAQRQLWEQSLALAGLPDPTVKARADGPEVSGCGSRRQGVAAP